MSGTHAKKWGLSLLSWGLVVLHTGCSGEELPPLDDPAATTETEGVDASVCYRAASCDPTPRAASPCCAEIIACDAPPAVTLVEELRVDVPDGALQGFAVAPDDSVWGLLLEGDALWLDRFDTEGTLVARSPLLEVDAGAFLSWDLSADEEGRAWLVSYTQSAGPTADDDFTERVTLQGFEPNGAPPSEPLLLGGLASSLVVAGPHGELTIAGNAAQNAHRGSLLRLSAAGEPRWIQSGVTTDGHGVAAGVAGLVVNEDGASTVVTQLYQAGNLATFGISRFDAEGAPAGSWALPAPFAAGYTAGLASDPAGNLAVSGMLTDDTGVVEGFSADDAMGWAFELAASYTPAVAIDTERGFVFAGGSRGIAVVAPGGASCGTAPLAVGSLGLTLPPGALRFANGALFYADQAGFGRLSILEAP
jgi:hypothetical protein